LVVRRAQVVGRAHALDRVPHLVEVVELSHGSEQHAEDAPFPRLVKKRFVLLAYHQTETVHAAEIMDAVHDSSVVAQTAVGYHLSAVGQGVAKSFAEDRELIADS